MLTSIDAEHAFDKTLKSFLTKTQERHNGKRFHKYNEMDLLMTTANVVLNSKALKGILYKIQTSHGCLL